MIMLSLDDLFVILGQLDARRFRDRSRYERLVSKLWHEIHFAIRRERTK